MTALHPNSVTAFKSMGFEVSTTTSEANPKHGVKFGKQKSTTCFSKVYDDYENPYKDFLVIMTCSHADENCPFIPGA